MLPEETVYNIGVSGHNFLRCINNLEAAVKKYQPNRYVVMETGDVAFTEKELQEALDGTVAEVPAFKGKLYDLLRSNPFFRLVISKIKEKRGDPMDQDTSPADSSDEKGVGAEVLLDKVLRKAKKDTAASGADLIIMYHPTVRVEKDGSLFINGEDEDTKSFREVCDENGILFLDMAERFLSEYEKD